MCARISSSCWVYILTNKRNGTLYVGVTSSLHRRIWQHKTLEIDGFTRKYSLTTLVYFEQLRRPATAIRREKEIKGWVRRRKLALIEGQNPNWADLSAGWYPSLDPSLRSG